MASTSIVTFNNVKNCDVHNSFFSLNTNTGSFYEGGHYGEILLTGNISLYNYKNLESDNIHPSSSIRPLPIYLTFNNSNANIYENTFKQNGKISIMIKNNSTVASHNNDIYPANVPNKDYQPIIHYVTKNSILYEYNNTIQNPNKVHKSFYLTTYATPGSICNHYHKDHINKKQDNYILNCFKNDLPIGTFIEVVPALPILSSRTPVTDLNENVYGYFNIDNSRNVPFGISYSNNDAISISLSDLYAEELSISTQIIPSGNFNIRYKNVYQDTSELIQFTNGRFNFSDQINTNENKLNELVKDFSISATMPSSTKFFKGFFNNSMTNTVVKYSQNTYINNKDLIYGTLVSGNTRFQIPINGKMVSSEIKS